MGLKVGKESSFPKKTQKDSSDEKRQLRYHLGPWIRQHSKSKVGTSPGRMASAMPRRSKGGGLFIYGRVPTRAGGGRRANEQRVCSRTVGDEELKQKQEHRAHVDARGQEEQEEAKSARRAGSVRALALQK